MPKVQHEVKSELCDGFDELEVTINKRYSEGWRLVAMTELEEDSSQSWYTVVFERELPF